MAENELILRRLREEPEYVAGFVSLMVDVYLDRPLYEAVSAGEVIPAAVKALQDTVDSPGMMAWLIGRVEHGRKRPHPGDATPRSVIPPNAPEVLKMIAKASAEHPPDRALAKAVIHNDGMRDLMRMVLENTLSEFGKKIWDAIPGAPSNKRSGGFGSKLMGVAKGVVSAVGDGLERQLEDKVDVFIDGALDRVLDMIVDRVSAPPKGTPPWQPAVIDALLDQPFARFYAETDKKPVTTSAQHIHALLSAWAHWDGLEDELRTLYSHQKELLGDQSLRAFLAGSGIEEAWRGLVEEQMTKFASEVVATEGFATWLDGLMAP